MKYADLIKSLRLLILDCTMLGVSGFEWKRVGFGIMDRDEQI